MPDHCWLQIRDWPLFLLPILIGCSVSPPPSHLDLLQRIPLNTTLVDGNTIAYLEVGTGPPVILIHGFGGAIWHWEYQQNLLSSHYRVITPDLLGSGHSDKPDIAYTPQVLVDFFSSFMDSLGIEEATLIGNSMGAGLAMGMALRYPKRVRNLILISGFPPNVRENITSPAYQRMIDYRPPVWLARLVNNLAGRWLTRSVLKEVVFDPRLLTPLVIERSYRNRANAEFLGPLFSLLDHLSLWETEFAPHLEAISQPTLLVWGAEDRVFPVSVGQHLKKLLSRASLEIIPKSGHLPQWETPIRVNALILKFLQDQSS